MTKDRPDHHDAELMIKVYDLRREATMRKAREAITFQFFPRSWEDLAAVLKLEHPLNAAYRQVGSYWEMVYGMVRHGIVNADYFLEINGEGLFLFVKVEPWLEQLRRETSPFAFRNAEWVARQTERGRLAHEAIKARVARMAQAR